MYVLFRSLYHNLDGLFHLLTDNLWCGRFNHLQTHHLHVWFVILNTLIVMHIQNVSFLGSPYTFVGQAFTFHLHLLRISLSIISNLLITPINIRLKLIITDFIHESDNSVDIIHSIVVNFIDKSSKT